MAKLGGRGAAASGQVTDASELDLSRPTEALCLMLSFNVHLKFLQEHFPHWKRSRRAASLHCPASGWSYRFQAAILIVF